MQNKSFSWAALSKDKFFNCPPKSKTEWNQLISHCQSSCTALSGQSSYLRKTTDQLDFHEILSAMLKLLKTLFKMENQKQPHSHSKTLDNSTGKKLSPIWHGLFLNRQLWGRAPIITLMLLLRWSWNVAQMSSLMYSTQW